MDRSSRLPRPLWLLLLLWQFACLASAQPVLREEGALRWDNIPEIPADLKESLAPYRTAYSIKLEHWSSQDGLVASIPAPVGRTYYGYKRAGEKPTKLSEISQAYLWAGDRPGSPTEQLLVSDESSGAEVYQLYLYDQNSKQSRRLSDGRSRYAGGCWSPDGKLIATSSNERNGVDFDLILIDPDGVRSRLTELPGFWRPHLWSSDGSYLVVSELRGSMHQRLHLYYPKERRMVPLDNDPTAVRMEHPVTLGSYILYLSDRGGEYLSLWRLDPSTGKSRKVLGKLEADLEGFVVSPTEDRVVLPVNHQGYSYLYDWNPTTHSADSCKVARGIIQDIVFSPSGDEIAFSFHNGKDPASIQSYHLDTQKLQTWNHGFTMKKAKRLKQAPRLIEFIGHDGLKLSAFLSTSGDSKRPAPVLIDVHGGPTAQHRPYLDMTATYLVNQLGVAVVSPNVRGSTGYGKTFATLDDGERRMDSVKDIGALLDWIAQQPELDSSRVAIMGGSYGGFVTLASLAQYSDRLVAGVDLVGVSDIAASLETGHARNLRRPEYGDIRDPYIKEQLRRISPLNRASQITAPLLVVHGANDSRVPLSQAEKIVKAVRDNGGECWYLLAKDDGHGMTKSANWVAYQDTLVLFLKTYLLGRVDVPLDENALKTAAR